MSRSSPDVVQPNLQMQIASDSVDTSHLRRRYSVDNKRAELSCRTKNNFRLAVQSLGCITLALCCVGGGEEFQGLFMICLELGSGEAGGLEVQGLTYVHGAHRKFNPDSADTWVRR